MHLIQDILIDLMMNTITVIISNIDEEFIAHQVSSQANIITIKQPIGLDFEVNSLIFLGSWHTLCICIHFKIFIFDVLFVTLFMSTRSANSMNSYYSNCLQTLHGTIWVVVFHFIVFQFLSVLPFFYLYTRKMYVGCT